MAQLPETRHSLISRLKDPTDQMAWEEFVNIYRPVVYRVGILKGLQPADAEDTTQKVMLSISKAVERWTPDPQRAKFRTWLNRIATNAVLNAITRQKPDRGTGDSNQLDLFDQAPFVDGPNSEMIQLEYYFALARDVLIVSPTKELIDGILKSIGESRLSESNDYIQVHAALNKLTVTKDIGIRSFARVDQSLEYDYELFRKGDFLRRNQQVKASMRGPIPKPWFDGSKLPKDFRENVAPFLGLSGWIWENKNDGFLVSGCWLKD